MEGTVAFTKAAAEICLLLSKECGPLFILIQITLYNANRHARTSAFKLRYIM